MLENFEMIPSDSVPSVTLDSQRRFYLNTSARRLLSVKPYQALAIAYNAIDKELAIILPKKDSERSADMLTSVYNIDKRFYMSARYFSKRFGYTEDRAPYLFVYDRGASDGSIFIFRLADKRN